MFTKALSKPGRKIMKAIKNLSKSRFSKKIQHQQQQLQEQQQQQQLWQENNQQNAQMEAPGWKIQRFSEFDSISVSWSLPSIDAKSIDTIYTYVLPDTTYYPGYCMCCHCDERDENERNENIENEMMR